MTWTEPCVYDFSRMHCCSSPPLEFPVREPGSGLRRAGAFGFLNRQVGFGPGIPDSPGTGLPAIFLVQTLKPLADDVVKQPFLFTDPSTPKSYTLNNVIASFGNRPTGSSSAPLGHPSHGRPGSGSGQTEPAGSGRQRRGFGNAILLEIRLLLRAQSASPGSRHRPFHGEDSGVEGRTEDLSAQVPGILRKQKPFVQSDDTPSSLDMVGTGTCGFPWKGFFEAVCSRLVEHVWSRPGVSASPSIQRSVWKIVDVISN